MVTICKRRIGRLGCLLGLILAVAILAGAVCLVRGLLGIGKYRASALSPRGHAGEADRVPDGSRGLRPTGIALKSTSPPNSNC